MTKMNAFHRPVRAVLFAILVFCLAEAPAAQVRFFEHKGMCDASAAVAIGDVMFLVANDEDNILRLYRSNTSGRPVQEFDLNVFLKADRKVGGEWREADIEGAARMGDVVYWIGSHGTSEKGRQRPTRRRLFATEVKTADGKLSVTPVGVPYEDLVRDLSTDPLLIRFNLAAAAKVPPKQSGGLNIEGLAATPQGALLIGFRNPVPDSGALIVPLENPREVVMGKAAKLGRPITLPLGGLGVRAMKYLKDRGYYLIIAGPQGGGRPLLLYRWQGGASQQAQQVSGSLPVGMRPEAMVAYPGRRQVQLLSDDGSKQVRGEDCKNAPQRSRSFRSFWAAP